MAAAPNETCQQRPMKRASSAQRNERAGQRPSPMKRASSAQRNMPRSERRRISCSSASSGKAEEVAKKLSKIRWSPGRE
eukprot:2747349-Pyramimonas_sp.AAC.1